MTSDWSAAEVNCNSVDFIANLFLISENLNGKRDIVYFLFIIVKICPLLTIVQIIEFSLATKMLASTLGS